MKILVISDIHSNIDALNAVWEKESDSDAIICAGDLCDYGFNPCEVIEWTRSHNVISVCGNHDEGLVSLSDAGTSAPDAEGKLRFADQNLAMMSKDDVEYLRALPRERTFELDGMRFFMAHYNYDGDEHEPLPSMLSYSALEYFEKVWNKNFEPSTGIPRIIVYGHSHQCLAVTFRSDAMIINPGSVSYRLGGDSRARGADYMVITDGVVSLRHTRYESAHLAKRLELGELTAHETLCGHSFYDPER